jgi:hypothetical protein
MKRILIISPHFPPSNLAAVHRSRFFAQNLPAFGWEPVILTVDEKYYEEKLDWDLNKLIPITQRIVKVNAFKVGRPRFIGDIGLRAFFQMQKKAFSLLQSEKFDFLYIPIPSFYAALLGQYLHKKTGIKYGIDYIDPWVHEFPGSDKIFSRHWFSTQLAKILEPIAVKHASLITGVSEGYYLPVIERNPHLKNKVITAAMPYGGEEGDHEFVRRQMTDDRRQESDVRRQTSDDRHQLSSNVPSTSSTFKFVYAGALLPKAIKPLEQIFIALQSILLKSYPTPDVCRLTSDVSFTFIGTSGKVRPLADQFGLYGKMVFEHPDRIPYLDVLRELEKADGIFILGSTEPHYTPSKVYQAVLSKKPILAVLHEKSTAVEVIEKSKAGITLLMDAENDLDTLSERFLDQLKNYMSWAQTFDPLFVDKVYFDAYTAKAVTKKLVEAIQKAFL